MPMGPRIGSHRIFFDVRADGVCREVQQNTARALTASAVVDQLEPRHVRNEVRIPRAMTFDDPALAAEISLLAAEAIGKFFRQRGTSFYLSSDVPSKLLVSRVRVVA